MANLQSQFGFKHVGYHGGGGAPDYQLNVTPLLVQLARLLGRAAARQWLSNGTADGEPASEGKPGT